MTKQGGGTNDATSQEEPARNVAAPSGKPLSAAASFEERVKALVNDVVREEYGPNAATCVLMPERTLAARCLKAEDALKASEKERNEYKESSHYYLRRVCELNTDVADLKAKLEAERKACDTIRAIMAIPSRRGVHISESNQEHAYDWLMAHDARRAAEGK